MQFKDYLSDSISNKDNKLVFDYTSNTDGISTKFGSKTKLFKPYTSKAKNLLGASLFTLYKYTKNEKDIVRALKGESSIQVDQKDVDIFAKRSAIFAASFLKKYDIDFVIYPSNASSFLRKFITELSSKLSISDFKYTPSIIKLPAENIEIFDPENTMKEKDRKTIESGLKRARKRGYLKLSHDINIIHRRYIKNFIGIENRVLSKMAEKKVLIIDDSYTLGTTMQELIKVLWGIGAIEVNGLTLFKIQ